jgi:hypothetical protein
MTDNGGDPSIGKGFAASLMVKMSLGIISKPVWDRIER